MAIRQSETAARSRSAQEAETREFWDRDITKEGTQKRAAFAETVAGYRHRLRNRRRP